MSAMKEDVITMSYLRNGNQATSRRESFFRGAHYILAGGIAGVAVGGVIAPAFGLTITQSTALLCAAVGALSVAVMRAFRIA